MSGIRDLIVVTASVLALSAVADADELRPIPAQGINLAVAAAPAVEVHHGPRVRIPSLGDKATSDIPVWRTATLGTYKTIDALRCLEPLPDRARATAAAAAPHLSGGSAPFRTDNSDRPPRQMLR